jgi:SARP family transcriptional regulator, regulator of embCAB operon
MVATKQRNTNVGAARPTGATDPPNTMPAPRVSDQHKRHLDLSLLGAFELSESATRSNLKRGSQRLIAYVALQQRPVAREAVAGTLWPEVSEKQAHGSLRSAIWRLDEPARHAMEIDDEQVSLAEDVAVDLREARALARRLLCVDTTLAEEEMDFRAIEALSEDLLPDWYDDWAIVEATAWRQLRLHALEALAARFIAAGRFADAIEAANAAIRVDPLRESSRAILVRAHLAEGNQSEAIRAFTQYQALMCNELGLNPTTKLHGLVRCC